MTDFYTLLKQSILDRGISDAGEREEIYKQARQAVIKQLWDFHPPLAADEIDTRVGAYDRAVERIEDDVAATFADGSPHVVAAVVEQPPLPVPDVIEDEIFQPEALDADDAPLAWDEDDHHDDTAYDEQAYDDAPDDYLAALDEHEDDAPYSAGIERAPVRYQPEDDAFDGIDEDAEQLPTAATPPSRALAKPAATPPAKGDWHRRWNPAGEGKVIVGQARKWWSLADDKHKVQILGGAISGLAIALVAIGAYLMFAPGGQAITVALDGPRAVSDAATATRIATQTFDVQQTYSLFDGRDPTIFVTTPENPVRFDSRGGLAKISSSISSPGVKALIAPGLASRLAGQRVRVTLVVRSSAEQGASSLRFAYQSGVALSHWQTASVAPTTEEVAMIWRLPAMRTGTTGDYILIEPGIPGDGTSVDVQSIRIDVLPPETG